MVMMRGRVESYYDDHMVVALSDLRLVEQSLAGLRIGIRATEAHDVLGLALLKLDRNSITQAVEGILAGADPQLGPQIGPGVAAYRADLVNRLGQLSYSNLDLLLKALRLYFSDQYPNWQGPRIGKNRGIDPLSGAPEIGPGEVGDPLPLSAPEQLDSRLPQQPPAQPPAQPPGPQGRDLRAGQGVLVGQIDGPMYAHPWLAGGYVAAPADMVPNGTAYQVNQGHAASVASCILDLAPAAQIHLRRVLGDSGSGDSWTAAKQMAELAGAGCDVVNVSVGQCFCDDGNPPLTLDTAVRLLSARSVVIAAAGNQGNVQPGSCQAMPGLTPSSVFYPAGCAGAVAVGALDQDGKVADFTPQDAPYIQLMASGTNVTAAYLDGQVTIQHHCQNLVNEVGFAGWATVAGTSYSAAIVTGEIARRTKPGQVTAREALDQWLTSQTPISVTNPQGGIIRPS
jgi:membrane-anchored mycosin MYCP